MNKISQNTNEKQEGKGRKKVRNERTKNVYHGIPQFGANLSSSKGKLSSGLVPVTFKNKRDTQLVRLFPYTKCRKFP